MLFYLELIQLAHLFFAYFFVIVQQNKFIHTMYKMHFQFDQTKIPFFFPFHPRFRFICDLCKNCFTKQKWCLFIQRKIDKSRILSVYVCRTTSHLYDTKCHIQTWITLDCVWNIMSHSSKRKINYICKYKQQLSMRTPTNFRQHTNTHVYCSIFKLHIYRRPLNINSFFLLKQENTDYYMRNKDEK